MRPKHAHAPQGVSQVFKPDNWRMQAETNRALIEASDPDIALLSDALDRRDNKEAARLIALLKARYRQDWQVIVRGLGRSPVKRRQRQ